MIDKDKKNNLNVIKDSILLLKQYVDDPIEQDILNQLLVDNNDNEIDKELNIILLIKVKIKESLNKTIPF